jgi:hypothetical protein
MRIRARHAFYLDFQLPVFEGVEVPNVGVHYGDIDFIAEPWNRKEPLFAGDLGQTLQSAEFSIAPIGMPGGRLTRRPIDIAIDRLAIHMEWDQSEDPTSDPTIAMVQLEEAVTFANFLIAHLRAVTGSANLRRIEAYWDTNDLALSVQVPFSIEWHDAETGAGIPIFDGKNGFNSAGGIRIPFNGIVNWDAVLRSMGTGTLPPFHRSLLIDAIEALATVSLREAVLCISSACEVCAKQYMQTQTILSITEAKNIVRPRRGYSFARRYFDLLPQATCGQSLSAFDPQVFADVESCYQERNGLMHEGDYLETLRNMGATERLKTVSRWRDATERALGWVDSLAVSRT